MSDYKRLVLGAMSANCWIIGLDKPETPLQPCIIIDPGDEGERIIQRLALLHYYPAYILLTHGHYDHLAALPCLVPGPWEQEAIIGIQEEDSIYLGTEALSAHRRSFMSIGAESFVDRNWLPLPSPSLLLQDGDAIGPLRVIHVPGHSPGSVAFYHEGHKALFTGDTLFKSGIGRTDLPGGNRETLERSLQLLFQMDGDITVYPGHGSSTTIKAERH